MKALITVGCMTDHGGVIVLGDSSFLVEGKAVHLDGMTHYCPKCKVQSRAIASKQGFMVVGNKSIVADGDTSSCGSRYMKISSMAVMSNGSGSSSLIKPTTSLPSSLLESNLVDESEALHGIVYQLIDETSNKPIPNMYYKLVDESGNIIEGETDKYGNTQEITTGTSTEKVQLMTYDLSKPLPPLE